jgi:hypothetical protein
MIFIQVKAMAGVNYIRAAEILAVQYTDREKCVVMLTGGVTIPCYESAAAVVERIEAQTTSGSEKEPPHGDGSD